ncbi:PIG-L family deacetylase [Salinimicrobium flavum]|uniref:PIG-L family deacetylase n=1 Tax=Salinimicrobium flavum TaxID=1737065 RepID=A0ABW5IZG7_9FLAO
MRKIFFFLFILSISALRAQQPEKLNSSEIFKEIQKLNFLGSVLYVAAHPDDENTRLISYLSKELNARTAYLSLTRGDGGQNLIGPELRELLGLIRTQELLAARRIDGGEQYFTRANDFGYSKHPGETLSIWQEEEILKDVVRTIRTFRPDVIINRFKIESAGETHGHHTSSAILSARGFELAGKASSFSESASEEGTWQPKKLLFNTSPWFYESNEAFEAADKSHFLQFDTGVYYPLIGMSNTEIASLSRSQHQSQGFGSTGSRGKALEYLELIAGDHPANNNDLFHGINTSWSRVKGGEEIGKILESVEKNYDFQEPSASIPALIEAYKLIQDLDDEHWKKIKTAEIKKVIAASAGLYLEAVANTPLSTPGEVIELELEAINRSPLKVEVLKIKMEPTGSIIEPQQELKDNESWKEAVPLLVPEDTPYTSPYWLKEKGSLGMYKVDDPNLIGLPETPREFKAIFTVTIEGEELTFSREIVFKRNDPVKGETYRPFEIVPPVSVSVPDDVLIFANHAPKTLPVTVTAMRDSVVGTLTPPDLKHWKFSPEKHEFGPLSKGEQNTFLFSVTAPEAQDQSIFNPEATVDGKKYSREVYQLDYDHIPLQTVLLQAETKLVKLDIRKSGKLIGYIEGAGDLVPQALEQIGYTVIKILPQDISAANLKQYDAVVMGIRAYNVVNELQHKQSELMKYVKDGGNLIVQYNTSRGLVTNDLAPYPLQLSRDRVTDENAEVRFLAKDHPVLNFPNKITAADFEGWVQERGLYFPDKWAPQFTPLLSMNDPAETPKDGSLLVAPYGKGYYIYTGLSFFREFPEGVPGAFRLFANMISLGKPEATTTTSSNKPQ